MMTIKDLLRVIRRGGSDNIDTEVLQALYGYGLVQREVIYTLQGVKDGKNN